MKGMQGKVIGGMNRRVKDDIIGKVVNIIGGEWKGYRGRVTQADDKQVIVEITSKCRKVPIDRKLIKELDQEVDNAGKGAESIYGGATVYDAGKTPMNYNTPSYYPQSPHWG